MQIKVLSFGEDLGEASFGEDRVRHYSFLNDLVGFASAALNVK
jgi:hypothetical protein